jgi:hypothetical protein
MGGNMAKQTNAPETYFDFISSFESGVNSGIEPLLLPKNQLASGVNTSVRGAYVTHRPPIQIRDLVFASPLHQTTVETGLFQGGGYYRPDYGTEQLIALIAGHLFSFTETGVKFIVADISVPGDPNNPTTGQVWMWQSEKWLIVQDGTGKLPIFYDGTTSRRSYGDSIILGSVTVTNVAVPPAIGAAVVATMAAIYTGPVNVPVIFNGAYYQVSGPTAGTNAQLTNINATPTGIVPIGSQLIVNPNFIGYTIGLTGSTSAPNSLLQCNIPAYCSGFYRLRFALNMQSLGTASAGDSVTAITNNGLETFTIESIVGTVMTIYRDIFKKTQPCSICAWPTPPSAETIAGGNLVQFAAPHGPNVIIGTTVAPFTNPTTGAIVNVSLDISYSGSPNIIVSIGIYQYLINTLSALPSNQITLINLTDVGTAAYVLAQDILSVPELPAGRMGAYVMFRNWMSLTDGISFIGGDIDGGAAGTPAYNYRDAVLKTTENTFLAGGGSFRVPSTGNIITAMVGVATLDTSLGQGPLEVGTAISMFSCDTPMDRSTWAALTNPILTESLIGKGPLAQNSTIAVNSDTFFRSTEGLASLILARRDFGNFGSPSWGNVPISQEMKRIIEKDNQSLLSYGSAMTYDNRFLSTAAPNVSGQGVFHVGLLAMNFDAISNLRTKLPPVYDGVWTGVNALQIISGFVNGFKRAFAFTLNVATQKIELYEFLPEETTQTMDNGNIPIVWTFETPILFNKDIKPLTELVKLRDGEIYLKDIVGTVNIEVQYRPDFYPCWTTWRKFNVCADPDTTVADSQPGYRTRIGLGEPDSGPCEAANNRPMRTGYFFQCRVVITGSCKWMGMRASAVIEPQPVFALPICDEVCP